MKAFRYVCIIMISALTLMSCSSNSIEESHASSSGVIKVAESESSQHGTSPTEETAAEEKESEPKPLPELPKVDLAQYYYDDSGEPLFPAQDRETELYGYINNKGEWVIEPQFYYVGFFDGGLAGVQLEYEPLGNKAYYKLSALINKRGEVVYELPAGYDFSMMFRVLNGSIPIGMYMDGTNYTAFMDISCNIVVPFSRENQITMFQEGLSYHEPSRGYLDTQGNLKVRVPEDVDGASRFQEGLARASSRMSDQNWKYGFIDKKGVWVIEPVFDSACLFSDGVAAVMQNDKWGLIDKNGGWVLEPSYESITTGEPGNNENRFSTKSNGKWGAIDNTGQWVIEPIYQNPLFFSEGLSIATLEILEADEAWFYGVWDRDPRNYGYIDRNGNWVVEPQYIAPSRFRNGLAYVTKDEEGSFTGGLIDQEGNWIWQYTTYRYLDLATIYIAFG